MQSKVKEKAKVRIVKNTTCKTKLKRKLLIANKLIVLQILFFVSLAM